MSPYGITKAAAEGLCRLYRRSLDVPVVRLRYFTVYGPGQRPDMAFSRFIDAVLAGRPLRIHGDGAQSRDFTFVGDAVEAAIAAGTHGVPGSVYNIAGGVPASLLEAIHLIGDLLGTPVALEHGMAFGSEPRRTCADGEAARRDLRFSPRTTLRDGLALQIEHHRALRAAAVEFEEASA
jgi:nucleoside-diphosphate-sugar epimerase